MAEMVDWYTQYSGGVPMLRRIGVVMASASHATLLSTACYFVLFTAALELLGTFPLQCVCCSRIGLLEEE